MADFAPLDPKTSADDSASPANAQLIDLPMEEKLRVFWEKNSRSILAVCVVALLAVLFRGALNYYQREREAGIESEFAAASTPEKLRGFIDQHSDHPLAGIGLLQLGDQAYSIGKYTEAEDDYRRSAGILKHGPFAGRAQLGLAVAKINAGDRSGEQDLKQLANNTSELKAIRAEASVHSAMIAIDAGKSDEAAKDLALASSIDPMGAWSQRAMMMRSTLSVPAAAPAMKLPGQP